MKYLTFIIIFFLNIGFASAIIISGKVINSNTKSPIPNVNIFISSTQIGTISDEQGHFTLNYSDSLSNHRLIVSCLGYQMQEFPLFNLGVLDIELSPSSFLLEEVQAYNKNGTRVIKQENIYTKKEYTNVNIEIPANKTICLGLLIKNNKNYLLSDLIISYQKHSEGIIEGQLYFYEVDRNNLKDSLRKMAYSGRDTTMHFENYTTSLRSQPKLIGEGMVKFQLEKDTRMVNRFDIDLSPAKIQTSKDIFICLELSAAENQKMRFGWVKRRKKYKTKLYCKAKSDKDDRCLTDSWYQTPPTIAYKLKGTLIKDEK